MASQNVENTKPMAIQTPIQPTPNPNNFLSCLTPKQLTINLKTLASIKLQAPLLEALYDIKYWGFPKVFRIVRPHTLLSNLNLFFLKELTRRIEKKGVLGDFVECGVYRGGSAGLLAYEASQSRYKRNVWLYDAFQGMPKAHATNDDDYSKSIEGNFIGSEAQTLRILHRLSIPNDQFKIIKGWFKDTLPNAQKTPIALLHIDCDFYDPVKQVLETFYDSVVPGGYVILNDYGSFQGCQLATDEFMAKLEDKAALIQIDQDAYFFQKPNKSQLSQD